MAIFDIPMGGVIRDHLYPRFFHFQRGVIPHWGCGMMIGDFHIHSKYSLDSMMDPQRILKVVKSKGFDTVAITDHNTIRGALEAKVRGRCWHPSNHWLRIRTDIGDIIGLKLEREVDSRSWEIAISEIKDQGGIVVLPHPYRDHAMIDEVAKKVDLIEIWNARCHPEQNDKALDLATSLHSNAILGSDAHFYSELGNVCILLDPMTLATEEIFKREYAVGREIKWSQVIGHIQKKDIGNLLSLGGKYMWNKVIR